MQSLERCFNEKIDKEMGNIFDTVKDRIQNAILNANGNVIILGTDSAVKSKSASSGRDAIIVTENGERMRISDSSENLSGRNNTLHILNTNDETQKKCSG